MSPGRPQPQRKLGTGGWRISPRVFFFLFFFFLSLSQTLALTFLPIFSSQLFFFAPPVSFLCKTQRVLDTMRLFTRRQAWVTGARLPVYVYATDYMGETRLNARSQIRLQADFRPDRRHQNIGHQERKREKIKMQDSKLNTTDWNISVPPHNDYVVSGVLLLLFNVVPFSDPTASNREETSAVFSHKRLQTVTLLPRHVSVMLPRLMIRSSKKESAAFRASSRIWQFPPENQNRANGNNGCDRPLQDLWSSALVVMFPWGLVVSWGGLNQLRGGAMCSVCSSSPSRSPAVPPSWITFFFSSAP